MRLGERGDNQAMGGLRRGAPQRHQAVEHHSGMAKGHLRRSRRHHLNTEREVADMATEERRAEETEGLLCLRPRLEARADREEVRADQVEVRVDPEAGRMLALMADSKEVIPCCVRH